MDSDSVELLTDDISERDALRMYLTAGHPGEELGFMSSYNAALHDARGVVHRADDGSVRPGAEVHSRAWIGAVAYLSLLDQIGTALTLKGQPKQEDGESIRLCLRDFAPIVADKDKDAIYALRCALVHDYSLFNVNQKKRDMNFHFGFVADAASPLIAHAAAQWSGEFRTSDWRSTQTTVNLRALGELAEGCNSAVMAAWHEGRLQSRLEPIELVIRYSVFYDPGA